MDYFVFAIILGCTYCLIALGYALVYSCLKMINFAHGEFCAVGAYVAMWVVFATNGMWLMAIPAGIIAGGIIAVATWFIAYRPLRRAERSSTILAALGASICLQQILARTFGAQSIGFPEPFPTIHIQAGDITLNATDSFIIICTLLLLLLIHFFWKHTRFGLFVRAVADDREAAECIGIHTDKVVMGVFLFAGMVAGIAGIALAASFGRVEPTMGFEPGLKAFVAALAGGLNDPRRAALGGIILGVAETITIVIGLSAYRDAIVFMLLVFVLTARAIFEARSTTLRSQPLEME
jgi:branched-chain amino acid transport system permease protein